MPPGCRATAAPSPFASAPGRLEDMAVGDRNLTIIDGFIHQLPDNDPIGDHRVARLARHGDLGRGKCPSGVPLAKLIERARARNVGVPAPVSTPYVNTIPAGEEPWFPGDEHMEGRIRRFIRWNAAMMVIRANQPPTALAGTSPLSPLRRPCTKSGSTTSSGARKTGPRRPHLRPGPRRPRHLRPPYLEHRLDESISTASAVRSAAGCPATPTRG